MTDPLPKIDRATLLDRYDAFLLDSYGVLVDSDDALPGAIDFVQTLQQRGKQWLVVTNDASRLVETAAERYRRFGLPIDDHHILTSGDLVAPHLQAKGLVGAPTIVLGPEDSQEIARRAGADVVARDHPGPRIVLVCDDEGYPFLETIEQVVSTLFACIDQGKDVDLVLPNPDLIYPKSSTRYGLTAGSVAMLIESALAVRFPAKDLTFARLGKPHTPMFEQALQRLGSPAKTRAIMLGDQVPTDIAGAHQAGIDSALVATGLANPDALGAGPRPTWLLDRLS